MICASGSVVEYRLAKARVAGSNPVSRSKRTSVECTGVLCLYKKVLAITEKLCYDIFDNELTR